MNAMNASTDVFFSYQANLPARAVITGCLITVLSVGSVACGVSERGRVQSATLGMHGSRNKLYTGDMLPPSLTLASLDPK